MQPARSLTRAYVCIAEAHARTARGKHPRRTKAKLTNSDLDRIVSDREEGLTRAASFQGRVRAGAQSRDVGAIRSYPVTRECLNHPEVRLDIDDDDGATEDHHVVVCAAVDVFAK
jgi:hypothetical protein